MKKLYAKSKSIFLTWQTCHKKEPVNPLELSGDMHKLVKKLCSDLHLSHKNRRVHILLRLTTPTIVFFHVSAGWKKKCV